MLPSETNTVARTEAKIPGGPGGLYGLTGDCKLCAFAIGKFEGTLKDQIKHVQTLTGPQLDHEADFIWAYNSNPVSLKGQGQAVILPPGYIFSKVSTHFLSVTQNFGAENLCAVKSALASLFESWPQLKSGQYEAFWQYLEK